MEADNKLAQALQEEEYAAEETNSSRARRPQRGFILDSEDEVGSSSIVRGGGSSEPESSAPKRPKTTMRTTLPSRAARDDAKLSIKKKMSQQIQDSDGSELSDLSEYRSDLDSQGVDDSESAEEDAMQSDDSSRPPPVIATTNTSPALYRSTAVQSRRYRQPRSARVGAGSRRASYRRARWEANHLSRAAVERAKLEKAHPEILTMWEALNNVSKIQPVEAEQPSHITRKLKPFQLEGLDWMIKQEKSQWKGGLLGDEMGMGKTIQAVSLIMSDYPAKDPTLVV